MARPVMEIEGLKELREALEKAPEALRARASGAVESSTFAAAADVRQTSWKEPTGRLERAISTSVRGTSGRVLIDDEAFYWRALEFGTIHMNAKPFVRPAAELEAPNFEKRLEAVARAFAERDFSASRFV